MRKCCLSSGGLTVVTLLASLLVPALGFALVVPQGTEALAFAMGASYTLPDLEVGPSTEPLPRFSQKALGTPALEKFFAFHSAEWDVQWDARADRPYLIQGVGIPLLPGRGNKLTLADLRLKHDGGPALRDVEARLRGFLAEFPELLKVGGFDLRLRQTGTVNVGDDKELWYVELQQFHRGLPVVGATVFFRINNGNIVQLGADRVAEVRLNPTPRIDRVAAFASALKHLGLRPNQVETIVDSGTLKILPTLTAGEEPAERYKGAAGQGYRHLLIWEMTFRRPNDTNTYRVRVDAKSGQVVQLDNLTYYANVSGGIYPRTNTDPEVVVGFPSVNVTNGSVKVTDSAGNYTYGGGTATSTLNGKYFNMSDKCGAISLSNSTTGDLAFGTSGGTDCTTPGAGGVGNTHATRTGFYHLTNINRKAATFLPANAWLNGTVTANMNVNATCNAFWDGSTVNFYRSGGGCSNTGEIAAVFLHEWGHGMDTNSGGAASDKGSGEATGDTFAFLETKDACIGPNFQPGVPCANCGSCTGVRNLAAFALGGSGTIAKPSNVTANAGINCDRYNCPYFQFIFIGAYQGPMGYEGHCESYIASSANWDLAQSLVAYWGDPLGWQKMDAIWYKSLTPSKAAYRVASGGKCNPAAVVDGCAATNWYTVYLTADDDDGNLANGTPNACRIWDAFTAHGIACGARPTCTQ